MRPETKKAWLAAVPPRGMTPFRKYLRAAVYRALWGLAGTMNFFAVAWLLWTLGWSPWEVPWWPVIIISLIITLFMVPWWWVVELARGTFQFPRKGGG